MAVWACSSAFMLPHPDPLSEQNRDLHWIAGILGVFSYSSRCGEARFIPFKCGERHCRDLSSETQALRGQKQVGIPLPTKLVGPICFIGRGNKEPGTESCCFSEETACFLRVAASLDVAGLREGSGGSWAGEQNVKQDEGARLSVCPEASSSVLRKTPFGDAETGLCLICGSEAVEGCEGDLLRTPSKTQYIRAVSKVLATGRPVCSSLPQA